MSDKKLTRRALLSFGREQETPRIVEKPAARGFSLDAFYADRQRTGAAESALPTIRLREGLAPVATTNVGTPELARRALHVGDAPLDARAPAVSSVPVAARLRLLRDHCLAWQRSFCTVCSEHCPEPGAIVIDEGRPVLVEERCTRCGKCIAVCPAPINAFELAVSPHESPPPVA